MAPTSTRQRPGTTLAVSRWSRSATATTAGSAVALAVLAVLPYLAGTGITQALVTMFLLVAMAALWNLLAGHAGMISFGQHAYIGIGAYVVWLVGKAGVSPFAGIALAAVGFGAVGGMLIVSTLYIDPIGAVAIIVVLTAPGGLWEFAARRGWSLLPVGYRVRAPGARADGSDASG